MTAAKQRIRTILVYALYIFGLGLLQTTLLARLDIFGSPPDLLLVLAILAGYMFGLEDGAIIGIAAGFFRDMLAGRAIGLGMLLLMYAAIVAAVLFRGLFRRNILLGLVQVLLLTLMYEIFISLLTFLLPMLQDTRILFVNIVTRRAGDLPGHLLANVLAALPLVFLLHFAGPYRRGSRKDASEDAIVGDSAWRVS